MTIPIIPGPFSFLASLGQGIAKYGEGKKQFRDENRANLLSMLELYQKGVLRKLDTDTIIQLGQNAGIGDFLSGNVVPKPENVKAEAQTEALGQVLPQILQGGSQYQKQQLASGNIPTAQGEQEARVGAGRAQYQAETIEAGKAPGATVGQQAAARAQAGVIAPTVAAAGERKAEDVFYDTVAARSVDAGLTGMGGNILTADLNKLSEQAWQLAENDARSQGYVADRELTKPYIDAAIAARFREAQTEQMRATARSGTDQYDNYLKLLQGQQQQIRQQITAMPVPSEQTYTLARAYQAASQTPRTPEERAAWERSTGTAFMRAAYEQVRNYEAAVAKLNNELTASRTEMNNALNGVVRPGVSTLPSMEQPSLDANSVSAYANFLRSGSGTIQQLDQARAQGAINDTDYAKILAEAYGGTGQPQAQMQPGGRRF